MTEFEFMVRLAAADPEHFHQNSKLTEALFHVMVQGAPISLVCYSLGYKRRHIQRWLKRLKELDVCELPNR